MSGGAERERERRDRPRERGARVTRACPTLPWSKIEVFPSNPSTRAFPPLYRLFAVSIPPGECARALSERSRTRTESEREGAAQTARGSVARRQRRGGGFLGRITRDRREGTQVTGIASKRRVRRFERAGNVLDSSTGRDTGQIFSAPPRLLRDALQQLSVRGAGPPRAITRARRVARQHLGRDGVRGVLQDGHVGACRRARARRDGLGARLLPLLRANDHPPRHRLARSTHPHAPPAPPPDAQRSSVYVGVVIAGALVGEKVRRRSARPPTPRALASAPRRARAPSRRGSSVQPGRASRFSLFRAFPPARSRPRARVRDPPSGRTSRVATPRPPARLARGREPRRLARPRAIASRIRPTAMAPDEKKRSAHSSPPRVRRVSEENKQPEPPPLVRSFD